MSGVNRNLCNVCGLPRGTCFHVHQESQKESFGFSKDVTISEQNQEITRLKKALEIANEAIGFYANKDS